MKIESEFKKFMLEAYPAVGKNSLQYAVSRVIFYGGAFASRHFNETEKSEMSAAVLVAATEASNGKNPELTLKEWAEKHDKR